MLSWCIDYSAEMPYFHHVFMFSSIIWGLTGALLIILLRPLLLKQFMAPDWRISTKKLFYLNDPTHPTNIHRTVVDRKVHKVGLHFDGNLTFVDKLQLKFCFLKQHTESTSALNSNEVTVVQHTVGHVAELVATEKCDPKLKPTDLESLLTSLTNWAAFTLSLSLSLFMHSVSVGAFIQKSPSVAFVIRLCGVWFFSPAPQSAPENAQTC